MKQKLFLLAAGSLLLLASAFWGASAAAQEKPSTSPLVGVWRHSSSAVMHKDFMHQMQIDTTATYHNFTPHVKLLDKGGKFTSLFIADNISFISEYGTYEILSPDRYVEHVEKSYAQTYTEKDNTIVYKFLSSNYLLLLYGDDRTYKGYKGIEVWVRVGGDDSVFSLMKQYVEANEQASVERTARGLPMLRKYAKAFLPAAAQEVVYREVEEIPQFPGGNQSLPEFLKANTRYPEQSRANNVQGIVVIRFVVTSEGSVERPEVMIGLDEHCNAEALRVVKSMPKWTPGRKDGKAVSSFYSIPFTFEP
jgi:protein TonB